MSYRRRIDGSVKKLSAQDAGATEDGDLGKMGTNYYLHLGKRWASGNGQVFTWATDRYKPPLDSQVGHVMDEYGEEMPWSEFYEKISRDRSDESQIGKTFS